MSSRIRTRTLPGLFALGILLLMGACSDQNSAERTLEALSPSPGRSASPSPSPSVTDSATPSPLVDEQPAAVSAPRVGTVASPSGSRTTTSRSSGSAPAAGSVDNDDDTRVQAGPPVGGGRDAGTGVPDLTGASGSNGSQAGSGEDGDSSSGRRDDSRGGSEGDEGDPGSDEDSDEDN